MTSTVGSQQDGAITRPVHEDLRLHIGGVHPRQGWKILNIQPGPHVDFVGSCTDLGEFATSSVAEVYASHVFEHLGYQSELPEVLRSLKRILKPGGYLRLSVPDLDLLCRMFTHPDLPLYARFHLMRVMYGGQIDKFDFHKVGFTKEILADFLLREEFEDIQRVENHDLFEDTSRLVLFGHSISLNIVARA